MTQTDPTKKQQIRIYRPQITDLKLKMLIYGRPGSGKTTLAASAQSDHRMRQVLYVNVEGGTLAIHPDPRTPIRDVPHVIDLEDEGGHKDFSKMDSIFWYLANNEHPFKTVIIDTFSELANVCIDTIMSKHDGKTHKGVKRTMDDVFLEDWGEMTQIMRRMGRKFRDLPMNVILICHDGTNKEQDQVYPNLTPKLRESVFGFYDVIGYMYLEERLEAIPGQFNENNTPKMRSVVERKMLTQERGKFLAKDRSPGGRIGTIMVEPSMTKILNNIRNEQLEQYDPNDPTNQPEQTDEETESEEKE
jgi:GTPase SAR1 family protein